MTSKATRIAFIVFFSAIVLLFIYMAWPMSTSAFIAFVVAVLFHPLYQFVLKHVGRRNYLAALITTLACFLIVLLPLSIAITVITARLVEFGARLAAEIQAGQFDNIIAALGDAITRWAAKIPGGIDLRVDLRAPILDAIKAVGSFLYQFSPHVIAKTAGMVLTLVITVIFLVVFFAEGSRLFAWVIKYLPLSARHQREISREIRDMITALLLGIAGTAIMQGILIGLGIYMAGFSNALTWGLVATLTAFIPIVGAALAYLGATAVLGALGRWDAAVLFLLYGMIIVSSVDNVIRPLVMGTRMRVHPVLLFIALLGGVRAFGAIGILVGPVLLAVFLAALRIYQREFASSER